MFKVCPCIGWGGRKGQGRQRSLGEGITLGLRLRSVSVGFLGGRVRVRFR